MSRRPKRKPHAPRFEPLEKRQMLSHAAEATRATRPDLDAFAWNLLEQPGLAAEMHLGTLAKQLGKDTASAIAGSDLGELLATQLSHERGYAAKHGLSGLIRPPVAGTLSAAVVAGDTRGTSSSRPDLEAFAWDLLEQPKVAASLGLGTLAKQLGKETASAIAGSGLGGLLAKQLSREPGYAARHGVAGLMHAPAVATTTIVAPVVAVPASTSVAVPAEFGSIATSTSSLPTTTTTTAGSSPIAVAPSSGVIPLDTPDPIDSSKAFSICSGCQKTVVTAAPPGKSAGGSGPTPLPTKPVNPLDSDVGLASGELFEDHQLVTYISQGVQRGIDLQYSSLQAQDMPIDQIALTTPTGGDSASVTSITAQLSIDGVSQGSAITYDVSGLTDGATYVVALQGDATGLATGVHNSEIDVVKYYSDSSTVDESYDDTINVVNKAASPYGAGWSIGGLQAISTSAVSTSVLITAGQEGTEQYTYTGSGYAGPEGDPSTLVHNVGGTWTRAYTDGTVLQYDSSGRETSETDREGNATSYAYVSSGAAAGALATITDPVGLVTTLSYDLSGKLNKVTDPAGRVTTVTVDSNGNLTGVKDPDSANVGYGYSTPSDHLITTETNPNGATATVTYDSFNRVSYEELFTSSGEMGIGPGGGLVIRPPGGGIPHSGPGGPSGPVTSVTIAEEDGLLAAGDTGTLYLGNTQGMFTDPDGNTTSYSFDSMYEPVSELDGADASTTILRDTHDWPTVVTDPLGRATTYTYDSSGDVTSITRPDGTSMTIAYGADSQPTQVTDYRGLITTFTLDSYGNATRRTDPDGQHEDWTYNAAGQVLTDTDRNGHTTSIAYDSLGRPTTITYPGSTTPHSTLAYNSAGDVTVATDELGHATTFTYDAADRVLTEKNPVEAAAGKAVTYTYDADGNVTSATDALNHVISYAYDARNRLTTMTDAANHGVGGEPTVYTYDGMNLISVTDPNGHTTDYSYDGDLRQTGMTDALGHATTAVYDAAGELTSATDANGHTTSYTYDLDSRVQTETLPGTAANGSGSLIPVLLTFTYNADDQETTVTDALSHTTSIAYDNLGRETSVTDALGHATSYGYDYAGNQTTVTDPLGHVTTYAYDARDRQVSQTDPSGGGTTTYTYDDASRLTSVTDPDNNVTSYGYDAANRETTETDPLGHVTTYAYDLANNVTQKTDRDGRVTSYAYDADDRETVEQWMPSGPGSAIYTMTITYDKGGRETSVADNYSHYSYGYDAADRLTTVDDAGTTGLPQVTLTYGYDNVGNRTSLSDTEGGVVSYTYDVRNELTTLVQSGTGGVAAERVDMVYDAAGRMTTLTRYSDTTGTSVVARTVDAYDTADRLTTTTNSTSGGSTISSYAYTLDAANRLTQEVRTWNGGTSTDTATYGYTSNNQLTSVSHTNSSFASESFSYDSNGDRNSTGYSTGTGNELASDGTYNYTYDNEGNLITKTSIATGVETVYTWDYRNRLTEVQQVSGGVTTTLAQYTYDALNNPIEVVEGGATRCTLYDGQTPLLDFNGSGTVTARYLSVPGAIDEMLARQTSGGVAWYLTDREGSVNDIINNSGIVIDHVDYGVYGAVLNESSPGAGDRFKYTGMELDAATGEYYDRARYYDASMGRFISQDPIKFFSKDANVYRFNKNASTNLTDKDGHVGQVIVWRILGAFAFGFTIGFTTGVGSAMGSQYVEMCAGKRPHGQYSYGPILWSGLTNGVSYGLLSVAILAASGGVWIEFMQRVLIGGKLFTFTGSYYAGFYQGFIDGCGKEIQQWWNDGGPAGGAQGGPPQIPPPLEEPPPIDLPPLPPSPIEEPPPIDLPPLPPSPKTPPYVAPYPHYPPPYPQGPTPPAVPYPPMLPKR